jgi:hypothetical protein
LLALHHGAVVRSALPALLLPNISDVPTAAASLCADVGSASSGLMQQQLISDCTCLLEVDLLI